MNKEYQLDLPELESIVIGDSSFEYTSAFQLESIVFFFLTIILIRFTQIEITFSW